MSGGEFKKRILVWRGMLSKLLEKHQYDKAETKMHQYLKNMVDVAQKEFPVYADYDDTNLTPRDKRILLDGARYKWFEKWFGSQ